MTYGIFYVTYNTFNISPKIKALKHGDGSLSLRAFKRLSGYTNIASPVIGTELSKWFKQFSSFSEGE